MLKMIALVFGGLYLLGGVVGFVLLPAGGVFVGIIAAKTDKARLYCQLAGSVLLFLGVLGLVAPTLLATLIAHHPSADMTTDNLLHLVSGIAFAYFGFLTRGESAPARA